MNSGKELWEDSCDWQLGAPWGNLVRLLAAFIVVEKP
jgi:hypothetical protein